MSPMFRLLAAASAIAVSLAACSGPRPVPEKDMERILNEMKGPDLPTLDAAMLESAKQAEAAGNYANAAQFYAQVVEKNPEEAPYRLAYAESLRRAGALDEAIAQYEKVAQDPEHRLDGLEGKGLSLMAQGEFDLAGDSLAEVMEKDTTRWRTINAIGLLFTVKQMYPEARQYFAEALVQSPKSVSVLNNLGLMEALAGDYPEAVRQLQEAAKYARKDKRLEMQTDLNLALVYAIKGDLDMAERTADPHLTDTQLLNNMGYYAHLADDDVLAKSYLNMALTASNKHYEKAWKNLETLNKLVKSTPRRR